MSITIRDISEHLGVSTSTVSKALNGYSDVSHETIQRVSAAAIKLGYYPNTAARSLSRQRTDKIGVVLNYPVNMVNDFLSELIPGAAEAAEQVDYNLTLYTSTERQPERINRICRAREVDGLLLLWPSNLDQMSKLMVEEAMPYIVLPRRIQNQTASYVAADHHKSGRQLTEHLIKLGHTRIGFTRYPELFETHADRLAGYRTALENATILFDESLVIETTVHATKHDRSILYKFLALENPPTALLCFTDPMAMRALAAAHQLGLHVPDDLSIVGHDGILTSGMTVPALTTARQPIPEMGRLAVECLLARIHDPTLPPAQHLLPIELVIRHSTGKL